MNKQWRQEVQPGAGALKVAVHAIECHGVISGVFDVLNADGVSVDDDGDVLAGSECDGVHARIDDRPAEKVKGHDEINANAEAA